MIHKINNLPLASDTWDNEEITAIHDVLKSKQLTMGQRVKEFEESFASYIGVDYAVMCNSGSSANLMMLSALKIYLGKNQENLEIIVPAVSWSTTFYPVNQLGFKLVFVDIDIESLNIDFSSIEKAVNRNTIGIFAVNLLGNPCNYDEIIKICKQHDLILLEDNCESLGAEYKNLKTGSFGLMSSHSTYYSHHISTVEGGLVCTSDKKLYQILKSIRAHGWTRDLSPNNELYHFDKDEWYEKFNFILPGYNLRPMEFQGAVGTVQLKKLNNFVKVRKLNALFFINILSKYDFVRTQLDLGTSSWFGFSMILDPQILKREHFIQELTKNRIESRPIVAGNFTKNPVMNHLNYKICGELTNADFIHQNGIFVGNHHYEITKEIRIIDSILSEVKI